MKTPPDAIYLQFYGDSDFAEETELADITWSEEKISRHDVRYVLDRRHKRKLAAMDKRKDKEE